MRLLDKKILLLGDSITEGWGASAPEYAYANRIATAGVFKTVRNYGVAATRIAAQKQELPDNFGAETFYQRAMRMEEGADLVFVFGGTNDYGHGDAPIGRWGDCTQDTFYGAYTLLIEYLRNKYEGARIVCATPIRRANENAYRNELGVRNCGGLFDYAKAVRDVCERMDVPLLDLYACDMFPQKTVDGLHPDDGGHGILAQMILEFLRNQWL